MIIIGEINIVAILAVIIGIVFLGVLIGCANPANDNNPVGYKMNDKTVNKGESDVP